MLSLGNFKISLAEKKDAQKVVDLFCEKGGNAHNWNIKKWEHYYKDYSEGEALSIIITDSNTIVAHYGMLPIKIGKLKAYLGLHAYIAEEYRGLSLLSLLMKEVDSQCIKNNASLICGFANPDFSKIKKTLFKWKIIAYLGFKTSPSFAEISRDKEPFYFNYSKDWHKWRFGKDLPFYVNLYQDQNGMKKNQILKIKDSKTLPENFLQEKEAWSKNLYFPNEQNTFSQPFSIKVFDQELIEKKEIFDFKNWFIEMGDSDTFVY